MTMAPGFLSEKIPSREKVTASFVTEIRIHLSAYAFMTLCMEAYLLVQGGAAEFPREIFALAAVSFFFLYCILEYTFRLFLGELPSAFLSLFPAVLLFLLFRGSEESTYLWAAVALAGCMRLFFDFVPRREWILMYGCLLFDALAGYLWAAAHVLDGTYVTDRLLCISLAVLTLACLQKVLCARDGDAFPFYYFILIGAVLVLIPMNKEPIDWSPVARAGVKIADTMADAADFVSYYIPDIFSNDSYTAGYSSLGVTGNEVGGEEKTQIILKTNELPYHIYKDEETLKNMKMRRTLYLAGGRGVDGAQLVTFLSFLHENGVDRQTAALFSKLSRINVEYAYLETADEIAPACSLVLTAGDEKIGGGVSGHLHKKGYSIDVRYLDIDYGSPYLIELLRNNEKADNGYVLSYEDAGNYVRDLYGIRFVTVMSREEYEEALVKANAEREVFGKLPAGIGIAPVNTGGADDAAQYVLTEGASRRMEDLAHEITEGAGSEYDTCKRIEAYLRQYKYTTSAVGGHDAKSDMTTSSGMADIADRFLFETGAGYCVHYVSSMVMLLRLSGIPARAAVGYRYVFPADQQEFYEVSSSLAHYWPEAYIQHVGWVPFEPTGAFRTADDFTWHRKARTEPSGEPEYPAYELPDLPDTSDPVTEGAPREHLASRIFGYVWPVVLGIVVLLALLLAGTEAESRIRYLRGTPSMRLRMDVYMIRRSIQKKSGEKFTDRGLLSDYLMRAPSELRPDLKRVFDAYYRVVYGGVAAGSAEINELAVRIRKELSQTSGFSGRRSSDPRP